MTERTIGQLVADATRDVSELIRHEIALAKTELKRDVAKAGAGAGMLAAAGFLGAVAFVLLCVAAAYGLVAAGLATWLGFLIVAVALLLLAAVLALVARGQLQKVKPPERTITTSKNTVAALKGQH
jgi:uncharacterized PurR-regulated membrane protein YhhQ (DUF165 family)